MSINEKLITTLNPFGFPVKPDLYTDKEKKYFTFNYADDRGASFGDNEPHCNIADMQVHFFMPLKENYLTIKQQIREALFKAGFTYPEITVLTEPENNIRHLVFECQIAEGREVNK